MTTSKPNRFTFPLEGVPLHPHIKLTNESFPRLLSTRLVEDDNAEYFGAFLTRSAARILIDFLNTTFRLRTCTIPIDGSFPVPCTQFYARRCMAPCVKSLCGPREYEEFVELSRLFLRNERREFELSVIALIDAAANRLDYERAAFLRDILTSVQRFWGDVRQQVWLDDAVDTFVVERDHSDIRVYIITTRRARTLGSWTFDFPIFDETDPGQVLAEVVTQFYAAHIPREIRLPFDFPQRRAVAAGLRQKFGRPVKFVVEGMMPERVTALKALARTRLDVLLDDLKPTVPADRIRKGLVRIFELNNPPSRIEAFDAAHISGTFATAGMSVWQDGQVRSDEYREGLSQQTSEIAVLREFIRDRFVLGSESLPDLIVVDGGRAHVNAAMAVLSELSLTAITLIGAVKPPGRHGDVSHFLTSAGKRIDFDPESPAMRMLKLLRDESHDLANAAHGQSRDMAHFYELAAALPSLNEGERQRLKARFGSAKKIRQADEKLIADVIGTAKARAAITDLTEVQGPARAVLPLVVPIRYDDPNGKAGDLRPIKTNHRKRQEIVDTKI